MQPAFPPGLRVIVRDWLSANHVVFRSPDGNVLIDTGYVRDAAETLARVGAALDGEPLDAIVNTHLHSDHMGGNAQVAAHYRCPVSVPAAEADAVARWDDKALLLDYGGQQADRFRNDATIGPGDENLWGAMQWRALEAPGHDMGALVFFNPEHRILISGDALWENGFGFVLPPEMDPDCLPATRATLDAIAALDVRTVIPGHGTPFGDTGAALERAYRRLEGMERDSRRTARSALKAMLMFALLAHRRLDLATLPAYLDGIGFYRDVNDAIFHLPTAELAQMLVDELERSGAVRREHGWLLAV
jgi:glyoxylase-like metal-dependent hydrolase (beta-lactamase superfamily II)